MLFNSYLFIFIFFPMCITGFYALKRWGSINMAKAWLVGFSFWFYGFYNTSYLLIMVFSIALNRILTDFLWIKQGEQVGKTGRSDHWKKIRRKLPSERAILITSVILNLVILGYFKYFDFLIQNLIFITNRDFPLKDILLPLGISFFTFQQIGYVADVYRKEAKPVPLLDYVLFISFFPQLVAGPIVTQSEMMPQFADIKDRHFNTESFFRNMVLFVFGLAKKVLIADSLGKGVDMGYSMISGLGGLDSFLVMIWYTLQLYFDFSGYSDMAVGLAGMLGFEIPVNFDSPYKSVNIIEFWKRWHISLTRFLTKNVYIPLGGNRKGVPRMMINIMIVYFLSGLWHGAGWNYVLWGLLHGIAYVIVRALFIRSGGEQLLPKAAGVTATFIYVSLCWVFFRATSIAEAMDLIGNLFRGAWTGINPELAFAIVPDEVWYVFKALGFERIGYAFARNASMICVLAAALVMVFACPSAYETSRNMREKKLPAAAIGFLGAWCVLSLSGVSTFLYFNF